MRTKLSPIKGHIKVEVLDPKGIATTVVDKANTLVLEAPKVILSQLIAPNLLSSNTNFLKADSNRPDITAYTAGPQNNNSIGYMRFGYYSEGSATSVTVAATDHALGSASNKQITERVDSANIQEYAVQFICEFEVTSSTATNNYIEAGLFTVGSNYDTPSSTVRLPTDNSFTGTSLRMVAHQAHTAVQAGAGSTIKYTWTLTMQEPS